MKPEVKNLDAVKRQIQADFRARKKARAEKRAGIHPDSIPETKERQAPVGAGFMGGSAGIDTRNADEKKSWATVTEVGKPTAPDAAPEAVPQNQPPIPDSAAPPQESIGEKLAKLREDLEEKRLAYARMDVDMSGKWARLKRTLGFNIAEVKDAGVQVSEEAYYESLWKYIEAQRGNLQAGEKEAARELLKGIYFGEVAQLKSLKEDEAIKMKKGQGEWSDKCIDGYKKATDWWRGLSLKKKLAYSGALFGLGFAGVGVSFTAVGASVFGARMVPRLLGAGAMYAGAKKWQEARYDKKREESISEEIENFLNKADWENRLKSFDKSFFEGLVKNEKLKVESESLKHKRRAFYLAAALPALGTAIDIYRIGFGGAGKGIGAVREGPKISAESSPAKGSGGGPPMMENDTGAAGGKNVLEEMARKTPATGAEIPESSKGILGSLPTEEVPKPAGEAAPIIPETVPVPKAVELGSDTIGSGGSLWRSTEHIIRGNPEKFGLDPNSKTFVRDARRMTQELLNKYAEKNGIGYEDLDEIARKKVRAGDILKIFKNPATGDMEIDYSRGEKLFGHGKISGAEAIDKENFIREKTGILQKEYLKYKGGAPASSVHEINRGGGYVPKQPEWLQEHNDNIAMKKAAEAHFSDVQKGTAADLREIQEIHHENITTEAVLRQGIATRGLLKNIINDAGIGNNNAIWEQPATKWYSEFINGEQLVSQDVLQNDSIEDINKKREILKKIFSQLPKPKADQTTWQALLEALRKDPDNLVKINRALGRN